MNDKLSTLKLITILLSSLCIINTTIAQSLDSVETLTLSMELSIEKVDNLLLLSNEYIYVNKGKSLKYSIQALECSEKLEYREGEKKGLSKVARAYTSISSDSAMFYIEKAILLAIDDKDEALLARNYNIKGNICDQLSDRKRALICYQEAERYALKVDDEQLLPEIYNNIGIALGYNSPKESLFYFDKAINYSDKKGFEVAHLRSILNKGVALKALNKVDSALIFMNKALEINETVNNNYLLSTIYLNLSDCYRLKGNLNQMKIYALKSLKLSKEINFLVGISNNYSNLQAVELKLGNYEAAINYGKRLLYNTKVDDRIENILAVYQYQAEAHRQLGNSDKALLYLDTVLVFRDSISKIAEEQNIQELQKKYELQKLEAERKVQEQTLRTNRLILFIVSILLFIISIGTFRYYRISKIKTKLSEKLKEQTEKLEQLDKTKTRFFTNISHELKTPLTLILNPVKKLLEKEDSSTNERYLLSTIEKHSNQLLELTNQMLSLTNYDSKINQLHLIEVNPFQIIQSTANEFEDLAESRKINYNIKNLIPEQIIIESDKYRLETIIKNLISNAIKFTDENGFVQVKAVEDNDSIILTVSDSGRGIMKTELDKIFERYYQSDIQYYAEGGTGIGLAICREYAEILGGSIGVFSKINEGSTFTVSIPKNIISIKSTEVDIVEILDDNSSEIVGKTTNLPTILIVEDNLDLQNYLRHILGESYHLHIVNHGKEAIEFLDKHDFPALIISDVMMPIMDGYQFLEFCKNDSRLASIPFVILTAVSILDEKLKFLRMGIDDYILKPFVDEELEARVRNLLNNANQKNSFVEEKVENEISKNDRSTVFELSKENQLWLEQIENIIQVNCSKFDFSVDTLAYEIALSRSQTHRRIKKLTGLTPKEYINNIRFEKARQLLNANDGLTIKAIAFNVGFKDEKYFSRKFKKHFGKNPSDYIRQS